MPNIFHTALASPKKFTSRQKMSERIAEYFQWAEDNKKPYTVAGLALFLGMTSNTLRTYGKDQKYADIVQRAKAIIEMSLEETISDGKCNAGIMRLMNMNAGWKEESQGVNVNLQGANISLSKIDINALPEDDKIGFLTGRISPQELETRYAKDTPKQK